MSPQIPNKQLIKFNEEDLLAAIQKSFRKYKEHGSRSNAKLKPLHEYIALMLHQIWGDDFDVYYLGETNKEFKVNGKYYPKDIDICITDNGNPIFCLGVKFVTSNYKQNANNYFESMMGETANIQAMSNLPYAQLIILRHQTPYYEKNNSEAPKKIEIINDKDILKYIKLMFDNPQAHRPQMLCVFLVDIDEVTRTVHAIDIKDKFHKDIADLLLTRFSPTYFFDEISKFKLFYNIQ